MQEEEPLIHGREPYGSRRGGRSLDRSSRALLVAIPVSALWSWPAYNSLFRRCYEIRLSETGICEFEAPLQTMRLNVHEIVVIRPSKWEINDQAFIDVLFPGGKLWVAWPIHDFGDFLDRLEEFNPLVKIEDRTHLAPAWVEDPDPTTREVIRDQPIAAAVILVICGVVAARILSGRFDRPVAVLLAIPTAIVVSLLLMFGVSKGRVNFED